MGGVCLKKRKQPLEPIDTTLEVTTDTNKGISLSSSTSSSSLSPIQLIPLIPLTSYFFENKCNENNHNNNQNDILKNNKITNTHHSCVIRKQYEHTIREIYKAEIIKCNKTNINNIMNINTST